MTEKSPPHSNEIEQVILGIYLGFPETQKRLNPILVPEDFHSLQHRALYKYITKELTTIKNDSPIDVVSLLDSLSRMNGALESCGGREYVGGLVMDCSTQVGLDQHLETIKELSLRRELIAKCNSITNSCYDNHTTEIGDIIGDMKIVLESGNDVKRNLASEIREWVDCSEGYFIVTDCDRELQIVTKKEKQARRTAFSRLVKSEILIKDHDREGRYRRILKDCEDINFMDADSKSLDIRWIFGLERYINTYPKTISIIAGSQDAGKTALLLNMALLNMRRNKVFYFSSEMDGTELKSRLKEFPTPLEDWSRVTFRDRSRNFQDVIEPDAINIIDFLEISDKFYNIGQTLTEIRDNLNKGIAIIALQKEKNAELGRGASFSLEKPRLYMTVDPDYPGTKIKVVKAKSWRHGDINPNGLAIKFKTVNGCNLIPQGVWEVE